MVTLLFLASLFLVVQSLPTPPQRAERLPASSQAITLLPESATHLEDAPDGRDAIAIK